MGPILLIAAFILGGIALVEHPPGQEADADLSGIPGFSDPPLPVPPAIEDDEAEPTIVQWRTEGTLPETWPSAWHTATIPESASRYDGTVIHTLWDGSVRVQYQSGPQGCVFEAARPDQTVGGGRDLAGVTDHAWLKAGFGGSIIAVSGKSCEGFGIAPCGGIC